MRTLARTGPRPAWPCPRVPTIALAFLAGLGPASILSASSIDYTLTLSDSNLPGPVAIPAPVSLVLHRTLGDGKGQACTLTFTEYGDGSGFWEGVKGDLRNGAQVDATLTFPSLPNATGTATIQLTGAGSIQIKEPEACLSGFTGFTDLGLEQVTLTFRGLTASQAGFNP